MVPASNRLKKFFPVKGRMSKWFKIGDDEYGNSQDMIVGLDSKGVLLEIGITYLEDDEVVFYTDYEKSRKSLAMLSCSKSPALCF